MAEYVVANAAVVPVREEPSEGSEQLTQLLFGEECEVLDRLSRWTKIRSLVDGQVGWVDFKMVSLDDEAMSQDAQGDTAIVASPLATATPMSGGADVLLTVGTRLPNYSHGTFEVLGQQYLIDPSRVRRLGDEAIEREDVCSIAQALLNAPYLWGGKNMMGMDCSGLTQVVYSVFGINLLRNAREQITQGVVVASIADALPGDLAFFDHADRDPQATNISHVGLLLNSTEIIHCSGCVHIDMIDAQGIHLPDGSLTHHLVQIKRYI
jgi:cell wall-associated NlpC family hydrolase